MKLKLTLFFPITIFINLFITSIQVHSQCLEDRSSLLLELKGNLEFNSTVSVKLENWATLSDCCVWRGVTCDKAGRVIGLDLSNELISSGIDETSSLFRLQFLESLNLANNSFNSTRIPSSFGNLTSLMYLNLSTAGFYGHIPGEFSRIRRLVTLDLSDHGSSGLCSLHFQNPTFSMVVKRLKRLEELYLDSVLLPEEAREWCEAISSSIPNLRVLSLHACGLSGPICSSFQKLRYLSVIDLGDNYMYSIPDFLADFSNLTILRLRYSELNGSFPEKVFKVPSLQILDVAENEFLNGHLPDFPQNGSLQSLTLSGTSFSGKLPDSIGNLKMLSYLDLHSCNFSGIIPNSMGDLTSLVVLGLSFNKFTGPIPPFNMSKNLRHLYVSDNSLTGPIPPAHFQGLSKLEDLDLSDNSFSGSIPSSLFLLPSLQRISLQDNQFSGQVAKPTHGPLSPLNELDLSHNKLEGPFPTLLFDFQNLGILDLSFNNFSGYLQLEMIQRLHNLSSLDLSFNFFTGNLQLEIFNRLPNLGFLHLSYNELSINATQSDSSLSVFPQLGYLSLASCNLQAFPDLRNLSRLKLLDLSNNQISGEIPNWIWRVGNGNLDELNLSCNFLVHLQKPYAFPRDLASLDLHSNNLCGELPVTPYGVQYVDYSNNNFSSSIPDEFADSLGDAYFLSISNNSITGPLPQSICISDLQFLDLSNNRLNGTVPPCLIEGTHISVLNLQNNNLSGVISETFIEGCVLEVLDLHGNHLEGKVPKSLANCKDLQVLNLGNNELSDTFPCFLKNSSKLAVLVLRSNRFHGSLYCDPDLNIFWPKLQIIDLALNNFSGILPNELFPTLKAMMVGGNTTAGILEYSAIDPHYQMTVDVVNKGEKMELVKILTIFTSIDLSSNRFQGEIPVSIGALKSLYILNLSHNAFTGPIPSSFGNLIELGSLDLSWNKLNGSIPAQLASLTFLSFLNLSYNQLVGMIPKGPQLQLFPDTAFIGNKGLCGDPLNTSYGHPPPPPPPIPAKHKHLNSEIYIIAEVGFVVGLGIFIGSLSFSKRWRYWYFKYIDEVLERAFHFEEKRWRSPIRRL